MICDSLMLRRIVAELNELSGANVTRVFPTGRLEFALDLSIRRDLPQILLNCSADTGRVHRADDLAPVTGADTPLSDVLRRHLRGATFLSARQHQFDRVVWLEFGNCEGMGPQSRRTLVAEIMGRHSNLLLLDGVPVTSTRGAGVSPAPDPAVGRGLVPRRNGDDETAGYKPAAADVHPPYSPILDDLEILECARHVTARVNRVRQSLPGEPYVPPPSFGKADPLLLAPGQLAALLPAEPQTPAGWFRAVLQGASDVFMAVVLDRAGLDDAAATSELNSADVERLERALAEVLEQAALPGEAYLAVPPGKAPVAYPVPLAASWGSLGTYGSLSAACQMLNRQAGQLAEARQVRQRLLSAAKAAFEKAQRREQEREAALLKAQRAGWIKHQGELLLTYLHLIEPEQAEITLEDWDTAEEVTIPLDPRLSPPENAQAYFDRYKKLQRVRERVPVLLAEARREREYLEDLLDQVEQAELAELRLLEAEMVERELLHAPRKRQEVKAEYRRTEIDGYTVFYGRSGLENAAVLKAARPDDLWFHVQSAPGGHVVIRTENRPDAVPWEVLVQAAKLAAKQSRRRGDATVEVDYTAIKHLQRPKGAPPGYVIYREFRTLLVRPGENE